MKKYLLISLLHSASMLPAQELFVVSEPASNLAAKSLNIRVGNFIMQDNSSKIYNYHLLPEIGIGISNKLMFRFSLVTSNRTQKLKPEGINLYAKYRFLSNDDVHRHFRMAAFGRFTTNNTPIHMDEINLMMHNGGIEIGTVATSLIKKTALSGSLSYQKAKNQVNAHHADYSLNHTANYSLSFGQLLYPKTYTSYRQTNFNVMVEFLGQWNAGNQKGYLDIVPSVQAIINSVARLDFGYRKQIAGTIDRDYEKGFIIKLEYNFFNIFK